MKKTIYMTDCKPCLHITDSNSKLGNMASLGYVPGAGLITLKSTGNVVSDCPGTCHCVDCTGCMGACYAIRSYRQYDGKTRACIENTLQLREDPKKHFADIADYIEKKNIKVFRYLESGEIENFNQFISFVQLAKKHPKTAFYTYTKNYEVLEIFFIKWGCALPKNLVILLSVWGETGRAQWERFSRFDNVKCFAVNADLKADAMCPAYTLDNKGKAHLNKAMTCTKCGLCFKSKAKVIGCLEH